MPNAIRITVEITVPVKQVPEYESDNSGPVMNWLEERLTGNSDFFVTAIEEVDSVEVAAIEDR